MSSRMRSTRRAAALLAATLTMLAQGAANPVPVAKAGQPMSDSQQQIDDAVTTRSALGLRHDRDYVVQLARSGSFLSSTSAARGVGTAEIIGIPLTQGERELLATRDSWADVAASIDQSFRNSKGYAGVWIGPTGVEVAVTDEGLQYKPGFAEAAANRPDVIAQIHVVGRDLGDLNRQLQQVGRVQAGAENESRIYGQSAWIDPSNNDILVGISYSAPANAEAVIRESFGPNVSTRREGPAGFSATRNLPSAPATAGKRIDATLSCTMGNARFRNSLGQLYGITAGHCGSNGTNVRLGSSGPVIGQVHASSYSERYITCDCLAVGPLSGAMATSGFLGTNNALYSFTAAGPPTTGQTVCESGQAWFESHGGAVRCGTVQQSTGLVLFPNGQQLSPAFRMSVAGVAGDSGAPVVAGAQLVGIYAGFTGTEGVFSNEEYVKMRFSGGFEF